MAYGQVGLDRVTLTVFTGAQQQVHASLLQFGPGGHAGLHPARTREHQRFAVPVRSIHMRRPSRAPSATKIRRGKGMGVTVLGWRLFDTPDLADWAHLGNATPANPD